MITPIAGAGALVVLFCSIWVALTRPHLLVYLLLFLPQFATLLTKIADNRLFLYAAYFVPMALLLVAILHMAIRNRTTVPRSNGVLLVVIFFAFVLVQTFNPIVPEFGMALNDFFSKYLLHMVAFVVAISFINHKQNLRDISVVMAISGIIAAFYGLYQYFVGYPGFEDVWASSQEMHGVNVYEWLDRRVLSTLLYSATYGLFLVMCAYLTIPLLNGIKHHRLQSMLLIGAIVLMFTGSLLSLTRGVWFAVIAGGFIYFFLRWQYVLRQVGLGRSIFTVLILGSFAFALTPIRERFLTFNNVWEEQYDARFTRWFEFWLPKMTDWHLFTGYGLGLVGGGADRYAILREAFWGGSRGIIDNQYITIFVSLGFFGLLAFMLLISWILIQAYRLSKRLRDPFLRAYAVAIFLILVTYMVANISASHLTDSYPTNMYFWLLLGILVQLPAIDRRAQVAATQNSPQCEN